MDTIINNYKVCADCASVACSDCPVALATGEAIAKVVAATGCSHSVVIEAARQELAAS